MATDRAFFVDVFGDIVSAVRAEYDPKTLPEVPLEPYYIYGHPREIASRLSLKDQDAVDKFRKFPLIALITDLKQSHGQNQAIDYELDPFTVVIVTSTKPTYNSEERTELSFKPILYPIYNLLIQKIIDSKVIATPENLVDHDHEDRYAWGAQSVYGNTGLIFNEYLDAIEITFNNIQVYRSAKCQQ